jgi:hypothetical protein
MFASSSTTRIFAVLAAGSADSPAWWITAPVSRFHLGVRWESPDSPLGAEVLTRF